MLHGIIAADNSLTPRERQFLLDIASGHEPQASSPRPQLLRQMEVAKILGVSRVTVWRMTKDSILRPVEILPGTIRYPLGEVEELAKKGLMGALTSRRKYTSDTPA